MTKHKIILDVPIIDNNRANCFIPICTENVLSMYFSYLHMEYEMIFSAAMDFSFDPEACFHGRVADGLSVRYDCLHWLDYFYGVSVKRRQFAFFKNLMGYIRKNLQNQKPCILHMDSYFLPWSNYYKKEHTLHLTVVHGMDEEKNCLFILDPPDKEGSVEVPCDLVKAACAFALEIKIPGKPKIYRETDLKGKIARKELRVMEESRFAQMREFAETFRRMFDPRIEFRDCTNTELMATEKLVDEIRKNIRGIDLFVVWLMWRNENGGGYSEVISKYMQIMSKWNVFVNLLYKQSIVGWKEDFGEEAYLFLNQIIRLEEEAYLCFTKTIEKDGKRMESDKEEMKLYCFPCDLRKYKNNGGFAADRDTKGKDLTGAGEFFVWDTPLKSNIWKDQVSYHFEAGELLDNVVCRGQHIKIDCGRRIHKISVVCCAEWGAVDETLQIMDSAQNRQELALHVDDISNWKGNAVFLRGKTYGKGKIIQEKAAVFVYTLQIDPVIMEEIILPSSQNMHILAITLLGEE